MPLTITSETGQGFVTIRPAGSLDSLDRYLTGIQKKVLGKDQE